MTYFIGQGHRLSTTVGGQYYVLDAGARVPALLVAAWLASGDLAKILAAGVAVEEGRGEASPVTAKRRAIPATRSALGIATRRAQA